MGKTIFAQDDPGSGFPAQGAQAIVRICEPDFRHQPVASFGAAQQPAPGEGHGFDVGRAQKAGTEHDIGFPLVQGFSQRRNVGGAVLAIGIEMDHDPGTLRQGKARSCLDRGALAQLIEWRRK